MVTWVRACDAVDAGQGRPLVSEQVASLDNFICNHLHVPHNAERGKCSEAKVHPIQLPPHESMLRATTPRNTITLVGQQPVSILTYLCRVCACSGKVRKERDKCWEQECGEQDSGHLLMKAWWLLCHPSPPLKRATHQLFAAKHPGCAIRSVCKNVCHVGRALGWGTRS